MNKSALLAVITALPLMSQESSFLPLPTPWNTTATVLGPQSAVQCCSSFHAALLGKYDADRDGRLSDAELAAARPDFEVFCTQFRNWYDADMDGVLSDEEQWTGFVDLFGHHPCFAGVCARYDINKDARLDDAELVAMRMDFEIRKARFIAMYDADRDGSLNETERWEAFVDSVQGRRCPVCWFFGEKCTCSTVVRPAGPPHFPGHQPGDVPPPHHPWDDGHDPAPQGPAPYTPEPQDPMPSGWDDGGPAPHPGVTGTAPSSKPKPAGKPGKKPAAKPKPTVKPGKPAAKPVPTPKPDVSPAPKPDAKPDDTVPSAPSPEAKPEGCKGHRPHKHKPAGGGTEESKPSESPHPRPEGKPHEGARPHREHRHHRQDNP